MNIKYLGFILLYLWSVIPQPIFAERIKDIAGIYGVRENQLIGYGLVVGLDGTGDKSGQTFTEQTFKNMLIQLGINIPSNIKLDAKNIAAVTVTAKLLPFSKAGQTLDVTVSSIGSAKSLRGGTLLMTPLKGIDGQVYAIAQGNLIVGGFGASGKDGSKVTVNTPSVGRIPNGATVEREVIYNALNNNALVFNLHSPDFTTAKRLAHAVNQAFGESTAVALDATSVKVSIPAEQHKKIEFISVVENVELTPGESPAKVIINARTGTVVISQHVIVKAAAVSHGSLIVTISENPKVSQPTIFGGQQFTQVTSDPRVRVSAAQSQSATTNTTNSLPTTALSGENRSDIEIAARVNALNDNIKTQVIDSSDVAIEQEKNKAFVFENGTSLKEIVRTINAVGAVPSDLVAILEALREVGALNAELIVI